MATAPMTRGSVLMLVLVTEGGLALVALAAGWFLDQPPLAQISWTAAAAVQGVIAAAPMVVLLMLVQRWPVGPLRSLFELVETQLVPFLRGCTLADLALISLAAGLAEELLFRGVLQVGIVQYTGWNWFAIVVAAVVFGAAHPISLMYALLAGLIGVYLGWLLHATGNLLTPVVTHAAYDFAALILLLRPHWSKPATGAAHLSDAESPADAA